MWSLASEVAGFDGRRVEVHRRGGGGNAETVEADLLCVSGGWNPNVDLASQSGAKTAWSAEFASPIPGVPVQAERSAGAARGVFGIGAAARDGLAAGREAARLAGFPTDADFPCRKTSRPPSPSNRCGKSEDAARASSTSSTTSRRTISASLIRRASATSSTPSATPPTIWRPTRARSAACVGAAILAEARGETPEVVGLPTFRPYTAPVAFGAFAGRATGDRFEPIRRTALARLARPPRRRHAAGRRMDASVLLSEGRRGRVDGDPARGAHGALRRRRLRRLDARQDRPAGPGRRRLPGPPLRQHDVDAARRPRAIWADAARGWNRVRRRNRLAARAGAFPCDDDDGRGAGRPRSHGVPCPDGLARTRPHVLLGDRRMGADVGCRAAESRHARRRSSRASTSRTRLSRSWRRAKGRSAACRRESSASAFRANSPTKSPRPRVSPSRSGRPSSAPGASSESRPTGSRLWASCGSRKAMPAGHELGGFHDRRRSRPRADGEEERRLHRPRFWLDGPRWPIRAALASQEFVPSTRRSAFAAARISLRSRARSRA